MQVMEKLVNMGFSEEQVTEALRCSGNKQNSAVSKEPSQCHVIINKLLIKREKF